MAQGRTSRGAEQNRGTRLYGVVARRGYHSPSQRRARLTGQSRVTLARTTSCRRWRRRGRLREDGCPVRPRPAAGRLASWQWCSSARRAGWASARRAPAWTITARPSARSCSQVANAAATAAPALHHRAQPFRWRATQRATASCTRGRPVPRRPRRAAPDVFPARERAQLGPVKGEDALFLAVDDAMDQVVLVGEVVVQLRLTGASGVADVVEADARHTSFVNEVCGCVYDPLASLAAFGGGGERSYSGYVCHGSSTSQ